MEGKIILNLAMSLDGFIVDKEDKYDWIHGDGSNQLDTIAAFDYNKFLKNIDVIVMGRISYDEFIQFQGFEDKQIVVATKQKRENFDQTSFVNEDIVGYIKSLKKDGLRIWLFGGSALVDNFLKADEIDEYIIGIIPVILGDGKKLFLEQNPRTNLKLQQYSFKEGVGILEYTRMT